MAIYSGIFNGIPNNETWEKVYYIVSAKCSLACKRKSKKEVTLFLTRASFQSRVHITAETLYTPYKNREIRLREKNNKQTKTHQSCHNKRCCKKPVSLRMSLLSIYQQMFGFSFQCVLLMWNYVTELADVCDKFYLSMPICLKP